MNNQLWYSLIFLAWLAGGSLSTYSLSTEPGFKARPAAPFRAAYVVQHKAEPFSLHDVRLLDGPFKQSQDTHARYLLSLEPDRLLARFRSEAGLSPKATNYPGWEQESLPGVAAGFYLSGCSRMYASTDDRRFLERIQYMLDELETCQKANGNGFLLATKNGKRLFAEIEQGDIRYEGTGWLLNGEPEPYYAMEKLFSGLRDAWRVAGEIKALNIAINLGNWLDRHMSHLNDEQLQRIMACEFGGMNWVLADLYADTGDSRYLALSKRWHHKAILDPLIRGEDILPGKHANTQFPKISGLAARYPFTGDVADRVGAEFFWDRVAHHHSYVTGDNSLDEHFGPPDRLNDRLADVTTETCNAWNMVRLTALLFAIEPRAEYAEFTERVLWNHILSAHHPRDGRVCYFIPLDSGHSKPYESLYETFACCTCSGLDSYARHADSIYFHNDDTLFVNLYIPSEVAWNDKKVSLRQETRLPFDDKVRFLATCKSPVEFKLALRYPRWATGGMTVLLNGKPQPFTGYPGNYIVIDQRWQNGDCIELRIPMPLRLEAMPDNAHRVAFFKGPVLLVGDLGAAEETAATAEDDALVLVPGNRPLPQWVKPASDSSLSFELSGIGRPRDVMLKPFFSLHERRYSVYWDCLSEQEWAARKARQDAERERRVALDKRTLDPVQIGVEASEEAHKMKVHRSNTGLGAYGKYWRTRWRDSADGWFSYTVKVLPDQPAELLCTFWGGEQGPREFDIIVDGKVVAVEKLTNSKPGEFYDKSYNIPTELTRGKQEVEVRFQAHPGNTAGGLFGVRTLKKPG
jgi:uncharacterized protein